MIRPAKVVKVDISSFPDCLRTCPIIAVKIPMAAILKIISTSKLPPYIKSTIMNKPAIIPSLKDNRPYFLFSSTAVFESSENLF